MKALNLERFILLKIKELGSIPEHQIGTLFNEEQETIINNLVENYLLVYVWNDDIPHDDYRQIQLTSLGEAKVFELQYNIQVNEFEEQLKSSGYNNNLVTGFLRTQDLTKGIYEILNIDCFLEYCSIYDINPCIPQDDWVVKKNKKSF